MRFSAREDYREADADQSDDRRNSRMEWAEVIFLCILSHVNQNCHSYQAQDCSHTQIADYVSSGVGVFRIKSADDSHDHDENDPQDTDGNSRNIRGMLFRMDFAESFGDYAVHSQGVKVSCTNVLDRKTGGKDGDDGNDLNKVAC